MTPEEESLRRGERFAQVTAAVAFLFAFFYLLYNPSQPQTAVKTLTDLPTRTPTAEAAATVIETATLTPSPAPTATMVPPTIYDEQVIWARRIIDPCCTREQITEIASGQVGIGIELVPLRPYSVKKESPAEQSVWLARPNEEMVLSFDEVTLCGLAPFGPQGPFVFCPKGDALQKFNPMMLAGKDSVGLELSIRAIHPGVDHYRGRMVVFNRRDLLPQ